MVLVKKKDATPKWLKPGAIIYCGFTGVVQEVATGDETIMVKVESPKRLAFGHTLEWLPFDAKVMKPATPRKLQAEIQQYRVLLETRLKTYDNALADFMRG
jgi:hypothetical protein